MQPVVSNAASTDKSREALMLQNTRSRTTTCHVQAICDGAHAHYLQYRQPSEKYLHTRLKYFGEYVNALGQYVPVKMCAAGCVHVPKTQKLHPSEKFPGRLWNFTGNGVSRQMHFTMNAASS